ncbi:pyridoxal-dependent decarboxylase [Lasiosphaeria hispida]|uniref:Pyridoxal-dependent decarboxylase n=1 Tax=Lasiosphaeria hispida TaxID=260671 RepID=A0AAJ0HRW1_9PEZI|nr:pyridoxal-dependent decarboxylase [Lasiosphaeria hispida]
MAPAKPFETSQGNDASAGDFLADAYHRLRQAVPSRDNKRPVLPPSAALTSAVSALPRTDDPNFLAARGAEATLSHLLEDIVPALNSQGLSGRYYGFVTGGALPIAEAADNIVSALDQNVQVHIPGHSASPAVEDAALTMLIALLDLGKVTDWPRRTFTTGATASNIMALACGREAVIARRLPDDSGDTVAEVGLLAASRAAGIKQIQILTSSGHSSLSKAASIVGLGHRAVKELPASTEEPWRLNIDALEEMLAREGVASIIAISAGEVNTGRFATNVLDMPKLRSLADRYGAWIHVDGAFGIFARALPKADEFLHLHGNVAGLELADSITADGHKLLNVPYDTGIFFCRNASIPNQVFMNPNAAYLTASAAVGGATIQSPLNVGIENSRRFRALPVYAVLLSEGREGMAAMFIRMVTLARGIAQFIRDSEQYEWLPSEEASLESTFIIVLFKAKDPALNDELVARINETQKMFVSGTVWNGQKAARIAVSSWRVDVDRDLEFVKELLSSVAAGASRS